jgi:hypothetical protein
VGQVRPALGAPRVGRLELLPEHPRQRGPVIEIGRRRRGLGGPEFFARHGAPAGRRPAPTPQRLGPQAHAPAGSVHVTSRKRALTARGTPARTCPVGAASRRGLRVVPLKKGTRSPSLDSSSEDEGRAFWRKPDTPGRVTSSALRTLCRLHGEPPPTVVHAAFIALRVSR